MKKIAHVSYISSNHDTNVFTFNSVFLDKDWIKFKDNDNGIVAYIKADQVLGIVIEEVKNDGASTNHSHPE